MSNRQKMKNIEYDSSLSVASVCTCSVCDIKLNIKNQIAQIATWLNAKKQKMLKFDKNAKLK